jgi:hypothetical protein
VQCAPGHIQTLILADDEIYFASHRRMQWTDFYDILRNQNLKEDLHLQNY